MAAPAGMTDGPRLLESVRLVIKAMRGGVSNFLNLKREERSGAQFYGCYCGIPIGIDWPFVVED